MCVSFSKSSHFSYFFQLFHCLPTLCPHELEEGAAKQKADKHGRGKGGGLESDSNVRPCLYTTYHFKALAKRSRLFTVHRSTCILSEMSRAFGHLVE